MAQLALPSTERPRTVKDSIIHILAVEWPLSAKKIYKRVRSTGFEVSYQAVHKALKEMAQEGLLARHNKEYKINLTWIDKIEQLTHQIKSAYRQSVTVLDVLLKGHTNMAFNTVMEMYRFILELMASETVIAMSKKSMAIAIWDHTWFALVGTESEQEQFRKHMKVTQGIAFIKGDTPIDKLLCRYYTELGKNVRFYTGVDFWPGFDRIVVGDFIIDVYFPEEIRSVFHSSYSSSASFSDTKLRSLYDAIFYHSAEIHASIQRNKNIAYHIRHDALEKLKLVDAKTDFRLMEETQ